MPYLLHYTVSASPSPFCLPVLFSRFQIAIERSSVVVPHFDSVVFPFIFEVFVFRPLELYVQVVGSNSSFDEKIEEGEEKKPAILQCVEIQIYLRYQKQ